MGRFATYLIVLVCIVFATEGRLGGRRLRDWEPCDTPGFFGDADDCRKFYRCAEHPTEDENNPQYLKFAFRCPSGTVFDETLSTCNHPEAVPNKPENCQVYDPEEEQSGGENNEGSTSESNSGSFQLVRQPLLSVPIHQWVYPNIPNLAVPYGNIIYG